MTATTGDETVIPHEQQLYLLWLKDAPQCASTPHPDLNGEEADKARRGLIGRGMVCSTGSKWTPTPKGWAWIKERERS